MSKALWPIYGPGEHSFKIQYLEQQTHYAMRDYHMHPYYEIFYLLQGERIYFMNDRVYTVRPGDLIVINPYDLHRTTSADEPAYQRILLSFHPEFAEPASWPPDMPLLPFVTGSRLLRFPLREQEELHLLLQEMIEECKEMREGWEICVKAALVRLLVRIYRRSVQEKDEPETFEHPMHRKVSEIAVYLNSHYTEDLTLEQVAARFFISPSYLSRIFKKLTGFHFREYLLVLRMKEAQRRLRETNEKIAFIAEDLGFSHVSHFHTTFKKMTGTSPLRYRKKELGSRRPE